MTNGTYLGRARISEYSQPEFMDLEIPEWGGTVRLRRMNLRDRMNLSQSVKDEENDLMFMARVCCYSLYDGSGQRLYSDSDLDEIMQMQIEPLTRIYRASMEFSKARIGDIDEAEKKSEASPSLPSSAS